MKKMEKMEKVKGQHHQDRDAAQGIEFGVTGRSQVGQESSVPGLVLGITARGEARFSGRPRRECAVGKRKHPPGYCGASSSLRGPLGPLDAKLSYYSARGAQMSWREASSAFCSAFGVATCGGKLSASGSSI